ncbi:unnamed protein product, partial [Oppiella nova]
MNAKQNNSLKNGKLPKICEENHTNGTEDYHQTDVSNHRNDKPMNQKKTISAEEDTRDKPLTINVEINSMAWLLFAIAFAFRFYRLSEPSSVVFDELHYGKFVSLYLRGVFFFDSQPPLGKQLIALSAYVSGYTGNHVFTNIGEKYESDVPLKALRFVPINDKPMNQKKTISAEEDTRDKPLTINVEINSMAWLLFAIAFGFRFYRLSEPSSVVFDELHYGKFVSLYLRGVFFFDSQPPLGKQLIALSAYVSGYNGNHVFTNIGEKYESDVPLKALRFVPMFFGSLIIPTVYHLIVEMGLTHRTATLAALLIIFDNALLTQSRFILMETILIFFSLFGILSFVISTKKPTFSIPWISWLITSSLFITFGFSVKYIGIFTLFLIQFIIFCDFWTKLANASIKTGGLASITKGQPLEIAHGSQITL